MDDLPVNEFVEEVDVTSQINIRKWLEDAITAKGGIVTGKGYGVGGADLDFEIDGCKFNVQVYFR